MKATPLDQGPGGAQPEEGQMEQPELQGHHQWLHGRLDGATETTLFLLLLWLTGQLEAGALCKGSGGLGADIPPGVPQTPEDKAQDPAPPTLHLPRLPCPAPFPPPGISCPIQRLPRGPGKHRLPPHHHHHNTHTFPNLMLPVCADATGLPCVSAVGACLVKYSSPCQSALRSTS